MKVLLLFVFIGIAHCRPAEQELSEQLGVSMEQFQLMVEEAAKQTVNLLSNFTEISCLKKVFMSNVWDPDVLQAQQNEKIVLANLAPANTTNKNLWKKRAPQYIEIYKIKQKQRKKVDMVLAEGYPVENHYVTTPDGYILNIHRIPTSKTGKSNGKVAYLQHGILACSSDWVIQGSGKSLAYILADEGYDVWMGNARGNTYSRNHTSLDPEKDAGFWMFSWHQIGVIDLPTMIDYVLEQTGVDAVYYSGHSQGTTTYFVMTSSLPEYNAKIKVQVSLAPIGYMNHMTSPLMQFMSSFEKTLDVLLGLIGMNEFLPSDGFFSSVTEAMCQGGVTQVLCKNALFALCGFSPNQMNTTLLATIMAHTPAGASTKQMMHYAQEIKSGKFRQYDWGKTQNKQDYGSNTPPDYPLSQVTAPVYLIYSKNDWLAGEVDVERLCSGLGNCAAKFLLSDYSFNHLDFTFGIDAHSLVYTKVLSLFARH